MFKVLQVSWVLYCSLCVDYNLIVSIILLCSCATYKLSNRSVTIIVILNICK